MRLAAMREQYIGQHVIDHRDSRLATVVGVSRDADTWLLQVRRFNGEPAPDVALGAVTVIWRTFTPPTLED